MTVCIKEDVRVTKNAFLILGMIVVLGAIHLATLRAGHEWGDDFSLYVAHARNIAEGRPYADTGYIYNPRNPVVSPRSYPPIFPLLLVPVYLLFGMNLTAMKVFVVMLFLAVLGMLALVYRKRLPLPYTLGCLALFALNPYVWQHKDRLLSETPFMLFAYLALSLAEKAQAVDGSRARSLSWGLLAGLAAYLAFGTRTVGVILIPSIVGWELLRRRRLGVASLSLTAAFTAGVIVQKCLLPLDGSYLDQLVFDPLRFARIALSLVRAMGFFVENGYSGAAFALLYGCLLTLACVGYVRRLRTGLTVYELFAAFNCLLLVFWPAAESDPRYLMPILPLFFLYASEGLCWLRSAALNRAETAVAVMLALAVLVSYTGRYTRLEIGPVQDGISTPESVALFDWIRKRTGPNDVFLFPKARALALYTKRHAVSHHKAADDEHLRHLLHWSNATHVVIGTSSPSAAFQNSRQILEPFLERHGEDFEEVYANPGFRVYRIRRSVFASR